MTVGAQGGKTYMAATGHRFAVVAGDIVTLTKPRITAMVLVATLVGYLLAPTRPLDWGYLAILAVGTLLLGGGVSALNQYIERDLDLLMGRTRDRPLPSGRMNPSTVLWGGIAAAGTGVAVLLFGVNLLSGMIALVVAVTYVLCYTPLKTRSGLNTLVGAIPGALPPVLGWAAAEGRLDERALALFIIMFVWQLPHFLAIAWLYRADYASAHMQMLPVIDPGGGQTRRQSVLHAALLVPVSLYPYMIGMAGAVYFWGALGLGVIFLGFTLGMAYRLSMTSARALLKYSILYLPLLFILMIYDKTV